MAEARMRCPRCKTNWGDVDASAFRGNECGACHGLTDSRLRERKYSAWTWWRDAAAGAHGTDAGKLAESMLDDEYFEGVGR
jgi:hypothetical protein